MSMGRSDLAEELQDILKDAADKFEGVEDFDRHLDIAALEMGRVRRRTLVGQITLVPDQPDYTAPADLLAVKYPLWGVSEQSTRKPWAPGHPGRLPTLSVYEVLGVRTLWLSPSPTALQIANLGATYKFFYFAGHLIGDQAEQTTIRPEDKHLLLIRAVAQALLELSLNGVAKPVSLGGSMAVSTAQFLGTSPGEMSKKLIDLWQEMAA